MRIPALWSCLALVVACSPPAEEPPSDAPSSTPAAATPAVSLADFAGEWTVNTLREGTDSVTMTYDMSASADPAGWTVTFPEMDPMPVAVTLEGDSVMGTMGPYESVLRPGLTVTTSFVARVTGGTLTGAFTARYDTAEPDSVSRGRLEGTRGSP